MPPPERRATDTPRSYAALVDLYAMGAGRSMEKLVDRYRNGADAVPPTRRLTTLKDWSRSGAWVERITTADDADQAEAERDRAAIRAQRRAELEDRDWAEGSALRDRALELLAEMPRFLRHTESEVRQNGELVKVITLALKAGPGELARALKVASELQRLSVGEPTERNSVTITNEWVFDPTEATNTPAADQAAAPIPDE